MRRNRAVLAPLALILGILPSANAQQRESRPDTYSRYDDAAPAVDVWLDQYTYTSGQPIRASFDSDNGAYVTVVRVTTDGRLYVLYPRGPNQQRRYTSGRDYNELSFSNGSYLSEPVGTGFVFAIASFDRFDYTRYSWGSGWRQPRLTTILPDPFAVVNSFVSQTLDVRSTYSFDYEQYDVVRGGRYADGRYGNRFYGDDAYYSCLNYFGIVSDYYCHSYGIIYGAPVRIGRTTPSGKPRGTPKSMTLRPLVPDPMLPTPEHLSPPEKNDRAGSARVSGKMLESLRRSDRPRPEPIVRGYEPSVRSEPVQTQRLEPRPEPRVISPSPHVIREQPRYEAPRVEHRVEQPRVETPRVETPRVEQRQRVESRPEPKVHPLKDQN